MGTWYCRVGDCCEPAERGDLCALHRKRLHRTGSTGPSVKAAELAPRDILREAALTYADADAGEDDAFRRADDNLRKAAMTYVLALWQPNIALRAVQVASPAFRRLVARAGRRPHARRG